MAEDTWRLKFNERKGRYKLVHPAKTGRWSNRYDGDVIWETKNCKGCPFLIRAEVEPKRDGVVGVCLKGVAWKVVYRCVKQRKCVKLSAELETACVADGIAANRLF